MKWARTTGRRPGLCLSGIYDLNIKKAIIDGLIVGVKLVKFFMGLTYLQLKCIFDESLSPGKPFMNKSMNTQQELMVLHNLEEVGKLTINKEHVCFFEYSPSWLKNGFSISPFTLPLSADKFQARALPFNNRFGVFDDCLPDGWSKTILMKKLFELKINYNQMNILEKLALTTIDGMGSLSFIPEKKLSFVKFEVELEDIAKEINNILDGKRNDIDRLAHYSGSLGGIRPKIMYNESDKDKSQWIVKFPGKHDPVKSGFMEFERNVLATKCGLSLPHYRLFNNKFFGSKRFDRSDDGKRIFMISAAGLLEKDYRDLFWDYDYLFATIKALVKDYKSDSQNLFRQMAFNVIAPNHDDHGRNFSLLHKDDGWHLSPAYDLIDPGNPGAWRTMAVNGKNEDINDDDLLITGERWGVNKESALKILNDIRDTFGSYVCVTLGQRPDL